MDSLHFSHNWGGNKKLDWANHFGQSFTYFQKKLSELFRSPNIVLDTKSSILVQLFSFLVGSLHFSHNWGGNKKLDWANHFGQSFTYFQKKLSELFRSPNIVLDTKSSILDQLCSFLVGSLHFSHNWGGNKKLDWANHFGQSFTYFQKKLSELFRSPNIVLDIKSSILDQLCSFLVDSLHFSHNWGGNKKLDWANHFGQSFTYFQKKLSELFRSPNIVLDTKSSILVQLFSFLVGSLHFSHNWVWNKKLDWANHFGQVITYFQKKYPRSMRLNFFDHRTLFWTPNRQF